VPFPAGGTTDILARILGQYMSTALGQPVIVDNRAGAGGNIGGQAAARAPADGYTLFMGTVGTHAINSSSQEDASSIPRQGLRTADDVAMVPNLLVAQSSRNPSRRCRS
jgi:tripartite-type tricarboxylate transporter receptor subunit TctC